MAWKVELDLSAKKDLNKLDPQQAKHILKYLHTRIEGSKDPRIFGQSLSGNKIGLWRYRIGDYRLVCKIEDRTLVVLVVNVGHRKEIYEN